MDKPHPPTPRRLRRALEEGDSPISPPLVRAAVLVLFALLVPSAARALSARFRELLQAALSKPDHASVTQLGKDVALLAGPLVAAIAIGGLAIGLFQTGGVLTWGRRKGPLFVLPGRLGAIDALRGLLVTMALLVVAARGLGAELPGLATTLDAGWGTSVSTGVNPALSAAGALGERLLWSAAVALFSLSLLDVAVRRSAWITRWKMSPHELREERRESEGDPEMKRARRRAHEDLGRGTVPPSDGA